MTSPGVKFPPPFLFAAGFLAGWLLHRRWPHHILPHEWAHISEMVGGIVALLGLGIVAWALATFLRHRTGVYPNQPATRIVRDGPYRWTRNPMYLSMTLLYLGLALIANTLLPLLLLPIVLALLVRFVIRREERYLESGFGDEYNAYRRDVRRWL